MFLKKFQRTKLECIELERVDQITQAFLATTRMKDYIRNFLFQGLQRNKDLDKKTIDAHVCK